MGDQVCETRLESAHRRTPLISRRPIPLRRVQQCEVVTVERICFQLVTAGNVAASRGCPLQTTLEANKPGWVHDRVMELLLRGSKNTAVSVF
jgi:hypothetical protein